MQEFIGCTTSALFATLKKQNMAAFIQQVTYLHSRLYPQETGVLYMPSVYIHLWPVGMSVIIILSHSCWDKIRLELWTHLVIRILVLNIPKQSSRFFELQRNPSKVDTIGTTLVPRVFPPPVFDRLQYAKTKEEGLGDLVTCVTSGRCEAGQCPIVVTHKLCVDQSQVYRTVSRIDAVFQTLQS